MASPRTRRLLNALLALVLLGLGIWMAGSALWQLGSTAVFVHKAVVVTGTVIDVRQKPFETWAETLGQGNWSMPGDVSYQPIVRFTLPGGINAIRLDLAADNVDYHIGDSISIISPPTQPGKALINQGKFLWGASALRLGAGAILALLGYGLLRRLRGRRPAMTAPTPKRPSKQAPEAPAPKPKAPRKRKTSGNTSGNTSGSTAAPRRRKKTDATPAPAGSSAPKKPRRSRRKKEDEQQPELPF